MPFGGFPDGKTRLTRIPAAFFSEILPQIERFPQVMPEDVKFGFVLITMGLFNYALIEADGGPPMDRILKLYDRLPNVDFSRAVLQEAGADMRVIAVPPCGWTDVGTPEGVARCAKKCSRHFGNELLVKDATRPLLDLADALRAYEERFGPDADWDNPRRSGAFNTVE